MLVSELWEEAGVTGEKPHNLSTESSRSSMDGWRDGCIIYSFVSNYYSKFQNIYSPSHNTANVMAVRK